MVFKLAYVCLMALCGTVLVHIAIVFLIPHLNQPRIVAQLQSLTQAEQAAILPSTLIDTSAQQLDPFFRYRVCAYDLDDGALQIISTGDVPFFSATLMSTSGNVLYSITDRDMIARTLNLDVRAMSEQQRLSQTFGADNALAGAVPVFLPDSNGYAIIRGFVPDKSWSEIVDRFLSDIICQPVES